MATKRRRAKAKGLRLIPSNGRDLLFGRVVGDYQYPGDPSFANTIRVFPEYILALGLSSSSNAHLSDNLLKEGAGKPPCSSADGLVTSPSSSWVPLCPSD